MKGVNINEKEFAYASMIVLGRKTIETRYTIKGANRGPLDSLIGQRVAVISTGKGVAMIVGYVTITGKKEYHSEYEFYKDYPYHYVDQNSNFGWSRTKVGYILSDPERIFPILVPDNCRGNVIRNIPNNILNR